eukprot:5457798-Amphidinium_carterae.1
MRLEAFSSYVDLRCKAPDDKIYSFLAHFSDLRFLMLESVNQVSALFRVQLHRSSKTEVHEQLICATR